MASTFSPNKLYELMATGEKSGTWGSVANTNVFSIIDTNLGGRLTKSCAGNTNVTISATEAQNLYHTLTGALTGSIQYIVPSRGSFYIINNSTSGAFTITVIQSSGTGVIIPQGSTALVFANPDGTPSVTIPENYLSALILASALPVASGGTGAVTAAAAMATLGATVTLTAGTGLTGGGNLGSSLSLAFANIANLGILSNVSGGSAAPISNTLTAVLDAVLGGTQGSIIYRGSSAWSILTPGTNGQFLQTLGAGANPAWATFSVTNLTLQAGSAPSTPAAGFGVLYEKSSDKNLYFKNDAGLESELLSSTNTTSLNIAAQNTAKAFVAFTQVGTGQPSFTPGSWFNVATINRTGVGVYLVTFTNALPTANYIVIGTGNGSGNFLFADPSSLSTGSFILTTRQVTMGAQDGTTFQLQVFGF